MHIDENLTDLAILVFTGPQIDLMAADRGFLRVALAAIRQAGARRRPFDHPFDDAFGQDRRLHRGRGIGDFLQAFQIVVIDQRRRQRLRQFRAITV